MTGPAVVVDACGTCGTTLRLNAPHAVCWSCLVPLCRKCVGPDPLATAACRVHPAPKGARQ